MLATPHLLAGAAVGKIIRRPWLAVTLAFASHLLLDIVPHLDSHGLFGVRGGGLTRAEVIAALVDTLLGIALLIALVARRPNWRLLLGAGFAGVVLDLVDNVPPWSVWFRAWSVGGAISAFHHGIQHNVTHAQWPIGFATQLLVAAVAVWVLTRKSRARV